MQADTRDELAAIRDTKIQYAAFLFLWCAAKNRDYFWGEGVKNDAQALHYVDQSILLEAIKLCNTGLNKMRIVDLDWGLGESLFYPARNLSDPFFIPTTEWLDSADIQIPRNGSVEIRAPAHRCIQRFSEYLN
jgi:hypothetical protein